MPVLAVVGSPDVAHAVRVGFVQGDHCEPSCSETASQLTCAVRACVRCFSLTLCLRWQVDTRYYTAEVQVEVRWFTPAASAPSQPQRTVGSPGRGGCLSAQRACTGRSGAGVPSLGGVQPCAPLPALS
jgi:hypothetical protein